MPRVDELELPTLDYTDPALRGERFHATMRALRAEGWLAAGPYGYAVLDREAAEYFLRTRAAVFPGMTIAEIFDVREGPLHEEMRHNILHVNGPVHTRLRSLVNPALSPRAAERHRPAMRKLIEDIFAQVGGAGGGACTCEFVEAIAKPYPSQAIAHVMGVPLADAPKLHHWSNWIQRQFDAISMTEQKPAIEQAVAEFYEYAWELLRVRRESPGEDLISQLIAADRSGETLASGEHPPFGQQGERLSDVECVNLVLNVLIGGVDTTQSQLAHAVRLLAEHPDQWALLAQRPELVPAAVEEALRYEPITPFTARILTEELTYRDTVFPAGTIVMICAFTGNRDAVDGAAAPGGVAGAQSGDAGTAGGDAGAAVGVAGAQGRDADAQGGDARAPGAGPEPSAGTQSGGPEPSAGEGSSQSASPDPDRFDITADRGGARVLTFGAGVHYCLGANLARVELQEALAFLAPRMPGLELAGEPVYEGITGVYGLAELPLRWHPVS